MSYVIDLSRILMVLLLLGIIIFPVLLLLVVVIVSNMRTLLSLFRDMFRFLVLVLVRKYIFNSLSLMLMS